MQRLACNKVLELEDFSHPDLITVLRKVFPHELERFGPGWPSGREYRKDWEVAMAVLALERGEALRPDARILGVGAGNEPTIFHLTTRAGSVHATDLYLADEIFMTGTAAEVTPLRAVDDIEIGRHPIGDDERGVRRHIDMRVIRMGDRDKQGDEVLVRALALLADGHGAHLGLLPSLTPRRAGPSHREVDARRGREGLGLHEVRLGLGGVVRPLRLGEERGDPVKRQAPPRSQIGRAHV